MLVCVNKFLGMDTLYSGIISEMNSRINFCFLKQNQTQSEFGFLAQGSIKEGKLKLINKKIKTSLQEIITFSKHI